MTIRSSVADTPGFLLDDLRNPQDASDNGELFKSVLLAYRYLGPMGSRRSSRLSTSTRRKRFLCRLGDSADSRPLSLDLKSTTALKTKISSTIPGLSWSRYGLRSWTQHWIRWEFSFVVFFEALPQILLTTPGAGWDTWRIYALQLSSMDDLINQL